MAKTLPTRRALLEGAALTAVMLAAPAIADGATIDRDEWRKIARMARFLHPESLAAVQRAISARLDPSAFSGITVQVPAGSRLRAPILLFGDWSVGDYAMAAPNGVAHVRAESEQ